MSLIFVPCAAAVTAATTAFSDNFVRADNAFSLGDNWLQCEERLDAGVGADLRVGIVSNKHADVGQFRRHFRL